MSRYIDANKLIERLMHNPNFLTAPKHSKDGIIDEIVYQPTADVVEASKIVQILNYVEERLLESFSDYSDDRHLYRQDHIRDSIQDAVEYYRSQFE